MGNEDSGPLCEIWSKISQPNAGVVAEEENVKSMEQEDRRSGPLFIPGSRQKWKERNEMRGKRRRIAKRQKQSGEGSIALDDSGQGGAGKCQRD